MIKSKELKWLNVMIKRINSKELKLLKVKN